MTVHVGCLREVMLRWTDHSLTECSHLCHPVIHRYTRCVLDLGNFVHSGFLWLLLVQLLVYCFAVVVVRKLRLLTEFCW